MHSAPLRSRDHFSTTCLATKSTRQLLAAIQENRLDHGTTQQRETTTATTPFSNTVFILRSRRHFRTTSTTFWRLQYTSSTSAGCAVESKIMIVYRSRMKSQPCCCGSIMRRTIRRAPTTRITEARLRSDCGGKEMQPWHFTFLSLVWCCGNPPCRCPPLPLGCCDVRQRHRRIAWWIWDPIVGRNIIVWRVE